MATIAPNVDLTEIAKFDAIAKQWWDPKGPMQPLHLLNPLRIHYIEQHATLTQKAVLDVGCGGGILSEALARKGSQVSAIDLSTEALAVAKQHAQQQQLNIDYQLIAVESLAQQRPASFDVVTCLEMLEHVPDPVSVIRACATLVKPGGYVFFSTINRNLKAFFAAIVGAEYILNLLPYGTHEYAKFIRPSELNQWAENEKLQFRHLQGISYNPLTTQFKLSNDVDINYLAYYQRTL